MAHMYVCVLVCMHVRERERLRCSTSTEARRLIRDGEKGTEE